MGLDHDVLDVLGDTAKVPCSVSSFPYERLLAATMGVLALQLAF